eukprot:m.41091 g.41091  ORF g.41091 m.41091 type:complete len:1540 (+) comp10515_c0_seq1:250-4869(+)
MAFATTKHDHGSLLLAVDRTQFSKLPRGLKQSNNLITVHHDFDPKTLHSLAPQLASAATVLYCSAKTQDTIITLAKSGRLRNLQSLRLDCEPNAELLESLSKCTAHIRRLSISCAVPSQAEGWKSLLSFLSSLSHLEQLDMSHNPALKIAGVKEILETCSGMKALEMIDLDNTGLCREDLGEVKQKIELFSALENLYIGTLGLECSGHGDKVQALMAHVADVFGQQHVHIRTQKPFVTIVKCGDTDDEIHTAKFLLLSQFAEHMALTAIVQHERRLQVWIHPTVEKELCRFIACDTSWNWIETTSTLMSEYSAVYIYGPDAAQYGFKQRLPKFHPEVKGFFAFPFTETSKDQRKAMKLVFHGQGDASDAAKKELTSLTADLGEYRTKTVLSRISAKPFMCALDLELDREAQCVSLIQSKVSWRGVYHTEFVGPTNLLERIEKVFVLQHPNELDMGRPQHDRLYSLIQPCAELIEPLEHYRHELALQGIGTVWEDDSKSSARLYAPTPLKENQQAANTFLKLLFKPTQAATDLVTIDLKSKVNGIALDKTVTRHMELTLKQLSPTSEDTTQVLVPLINTPFLQQAMYILDQFVIEAAKWEQKPAKDVSTPSIEVKVPRSFVSQALHKMQGAPLLKRGNVSTVGRLALFLKRFDVILKCKSRTCIFQIPGSSAELQQLLRFINTSKCLSDVPLQYVRIKLLGEPASKFEDLLKKQDMMSPELAPADRSLLHCRLDLGDPALENPLISVQSISNQSTFTLSLEKDPRIKLLNLVLNPTPIRANEDNLLTTVHRAVFERWMDEKWLQTLIGDIDPGKLQQLRSMKLETADAITLPGTTPYLYTDSKEGGYQAGEKTADGAALYRFNCIIRALMVDNTPTIEINLTGSLWVIVPPMRGIVGKRGELRVSTCHIPFLQNATHAKAASYDKAWVEYLNKVVQQADVKSASTYATPRVFFVVTFNSGAHYRAIRQLFATVHQNHTSQQQDIFTWHCDVSDKSPDEIAAFQQRLRDEAPLASCFVRATSLHVNALFESDFQQAQHAISEFTASSAGLAVLETVAPAETAIVSSTQHHQLGGTEGVLGFATAPSRPHFYAQPPRPPLRTRASPMQSHAVYAPPGTWPYMAQQHQYQHQPAFMLSTPAIPSSPSWYQSCTGSRSHSTAKPQFGASPSFVTPHSVARSPVTPHDARRPSKATHSHEKSLKHEQQPRLDKHHHDQQGSATATSKINGALAYASASSVVVHEQKASKGAASDSRRKSKASTTSKKQVQTVFPASDTKKNATVSLFIAREFCSTGIMLRLARRTYQQVLQDRCNSELEKRLGHVPTQKEQVVFSKAPNRKGLATCVRLRGQNQHVMHVLKTIVLREIAALEKQAQVLMIPCGFDVAREQIDFASLQLEYCCDVTIHPPTSDKQEGKVPAFAGMQAIVVTYYPSYPLSDKLDSTDPRLDAAKKFPEKEPTEKNIRAKLDELLQGHRVVNPDRFRLVVAAQCGGTLLAAGTEMVKVGMQEGSDLVELQKYMPQHHQDTASTPSVFVHKDLLVGVRI